MSREKRKHLASCIIAIVMKRIRDLLTVDRQITTTCNLLASAPVRHHSSRDEPLTTDGGLGIWGSCSLLYFHVVRNSSIINKRQYPSIHIAFGIEACLQTAPEKQCRDDSRSHCSSNRGDSIDVHWPEM